MTRIYWAGQIPAAVVVDWKREEEEEVGAVAVAGLVGLEEWVVWHPCVCGFWVLFLGVFGDSRYGSFIGI